MSRLFDVDVVAVLSGRDVSDLMEKKSLQCDYIISTVDLPRLPDGFYIKVNPIFTQKDYKNILQFIDARQAGAVIWRPPITLWRSPPNTVPTAILTS